MPRQALTKKHWKLLNLIRLNKYSEEELAQKTGLPEQHVYDLIVKSPKAGKVGELFTQELTKAQQEIEQRISHRTNLVREKLVHRLHQWVEACGTGSQLDTKTKHKMLIDAINAMNKSMPYQVNIEQYNWKTGMSAEEAVSEFNRIKGLAAQFSIRSRVQSPASGGAAEGSVLNGQALQAPENAQDTVLPAKPKAEKLSRESRFGKGDIRGQ